MIMFPEELMGIISKYKLNNQENIREIYENLCRIITSLKNIQNNMASDLYKISVSDDTTNSTEILNDINALKEQIAYIKSFTSSKEEKEVEENTSPDIPEELPAPIFDKTTYLYLVSDDICPFCNVKFVQHMVYYQRNLNNHLIGERVKWYRCPNCNRLFVLDYDIEDFDFDNTNIVLNKEKYDEIPSIDIYSVIVLSNTLRCSAKHRTKDLIAKIPLLNEVGKLSYVKINASYCFDCDRFTILKDDYNAIKEIIMCKVIDETTEYRSNENSSFEGEQSKSILFQYGYNVQTKKDLSKEQRHIILSSIIEANIMNRRDVINHINTLIERGSKIPSWKNATQKWKEDRQFVEEYENNTLPEVIFNSIILRYRKPV